MQHPRKQQGWFGLIALLFALAIVAFMARTVLKEYGGFFAGATKGTEASARGDRSRAVGPADEVRDAAAVTPRDAMARVRSLGDTVRQQAQEIDQRIDNANK